MVLKRRKRLTDETRKRISESYNRGHTISFISDFFGIPESTVRNVVKVFLKTGRIASLPSGGCKNIKISSEIKSRIIQIVDETPDISLKRIAVKVNEEFSINLGRSTIDSCLDNFHYTLKKLILVPEQRNTPENITSRYNYALEFLSILGSTSDTNIFFVDEVGYNVSMRSRRGRSLRGTSPHLEVSNIRSRNLSVCCAMNKYGLTYKKISTRAYNTNLFLGYIQGFFDFLVGLELRNCVIVMDNVPFHKSVVIREEFESNGHRIVFLPPYSPYLNPIENLFSKWKGFVKSSNPTSEEHLATLIDQGLDTITASDCNGFFMEMIRNIDRCLRKERFDE
jgi:transposase